MSLDQAEGSTEDRASQTVMMAAWADVSNTKCQELADPGLGP